MIREYRTAIITGASRGIGVYIAKALAAEGMNLVLAARNSAGLNSVANGIKASGGRVATVPTDITDLSALKNLVSIAETEFGAIDVLVNNAVLDNTGFFHLASPDAIEQAISVNLTAPIVLTRLVLPGMLERRRGHIVNFSTLGAKIPFPYDVIYAASKAGLTHFTTSLRAECQGTGVSASAILAGGFAEAGFFTQTLKDLGITKPNSVPTSPPEAAGKAVINALKNNLAEVAIPTPALLFTRIPALGTLFLKGSGITATLKDIATIRGHTKANL